jgi:hypothetical protein
VKKEIGISNKHFRRVDFENEIGQIFAEVKKSYPDLGRGKVYFTLYRRSSYS